MALLTAADDATLGRALQAGDPGAVEELFLRYRALIHDAVRHLVGDPAVAEDVTQMAFLRALEERRSLREPARVRAWLSRIAMNLAKEHVRRERGWRHLEVRDSLPTSERGPEDVVLQHRDEQLVWSALASLDERQRVALDLAVRHNLAAADVARALGITVAHAHVILHRARLALGHAIRSLLVAQSRTHSDRLAAMVPTGVRQLTPWQRRSVEQHLRRCDVCKDRAALLTSPLELLGGIAILPLPASLAGGWHPPHGPIAPQNTAARVGLRSALRTPAFLAGGAALLLFGGIGGLLFLHNAPHHPPAQSARRPGPSLSPAAEALPTLATPTPSPSDTPSPTAPPTPSGAQAWAAGQQLVRSTKGYHVHYAAMYVYPDGGPAGNPLQFDLQVQPGGDFSGSYTAIDGFIGQFDIRRVSGVLSVRHINAGGNFGIAGAPEDALQFFDISEQQADALGDAWFPLTGSGQQPAATRLTTALGPYVSARALADQVLAPPAGPLTVGPGLDPGSTEVDGGGRRLTYRASPDPFVLFSTSVVDLRIDGLTGGAAGSP